MDRAPHMTLLSTFESWSLVLGLALGTFLIRYSFIGLFADRDMPAWLDRALKLMVPAIFAAIVFSGVAIVNGTLGGEVAGLEHWPRYAAAVAAVLAAALTRGHMLVTLGVGMATLHGLPWLFR
jgi:branched-subunit amino acid transport protein